MCVWMFGAVVVMAAELPVEVEEITDDDLDTSMLYGTRVVVMEGAKYYASADEFGSGPYGTIGNQYTPLGTDIYVGGFARLNERGILEEYRGYNPRNVPVSNYWQDDANDMPWDQIWVEIFLDPDGDFPIGWVPVRSIVVLNGILGDGRTNAVFQNGVKVVPKEDLEPSFEVADFDDLQPEVIDDVLPDPGNMIEDRVIHDQDAKDADLEDSGEDDDPFISTREIAYAIEDYAEDGEKVALFLDASGSVSKYMSDIADYGGYVDKVNRADAIVAFACRYKLIAAEDYLEVDVDSSATDIYLPINSLADIASYDRIIIVTDTEHNVDYSVLNKRFGFRGKIVVVCTYELRYIQQSTIQEIEEAFNTKVYLCRLDNELDRIRAIEELDK